jgi:hypothetical protein
MLLLAFVVCTGVAIFVSGMRPAGDPGVAPWAVQVVGYVCGLVAAVLLLATGRGADAPERRMGLLLLPALLALVLLDALTAATDSGGANIGAGFVRLVLLVVIAVGTVRVARAVAAESRQR